jgi:hypothetical protein
MPESSLYHFRNFTHLFTVFLMAHHVTVVCKIFSLSERENKRSETVKKRALNRAKTGLKRGRNGENGLETAGARGVRSQCLIDPYSMKPLAISG